MIRNFFPRKMEFLLRTSHAYTRTDLATDFHLTFLPVFSLENEFSEKNLLSENGGEAFDCSTTKTVDFTAVDSNANFQGIFLEKKLPLAVFEIRRKNISRRPKFYIFSMSKINFPKNAEEIFT